MKEHANEQPTCSQLGHPMPHYDGRCASCRDVHERREERIQAFRRDAAASGRNLTAQPSGDDAALNQRIAAVFDGITACKVQDFVQSEIAALRARLALHAGDAQSLNNEIEQMRRNAEDNAAQVESLTRERNQHAADKVAIRDVLVGHGHGTHIGEATKDAVAAVCRRLTAAEDQRDIALADLAAERERASSLAAWCGQLKQQAEAKCGGYLDERDRLRAEAERWKDPAERAESIRRDLVAAACRLSECLNTANIDTRALRAELTVMAAQRSAT